MELVQKKVKAGKTQTVVAPEEEAPSQGAEVIDLTELLARSLKGKAGKAAPAKAASKVAAKKIAPAAKTAKTRKAA